MSTNCHKSINRLSAINQSINTLFLRNILLNKSLQVKLFH